MKKLFLLSIILLVTADFCLPTSAQEYPYRYAFTRQTLRMNQYPELHLLDPTSGNVNIITIPIYTEVAEALASPDGKWLALIPNATPFDEVLVLYNVASGEIRTLPVNMVLDRETPWGILGESAVATWSPDSKYLAYVSYQNRQQDVFVYSLESDSTQNITNDAEQHASLTWGTNHRLAFASESCVSGAGCNISIKLYDIDTMSEIASVEAPFDAPLYYGKGLCNLHLSPNNEFASFSRYCSVDSISEIHLIDLNIMQVRTLSNFTENEFPIPNAPPDFGGWRFGAYDTYWHDDHTLLVGTSVGIDLGITQENTYFYDMQNINTTSELLQTMAQQWSPNPVTGELAFLSTVGYLDITSAQTQLASWDGSQLNISASYAPGCNQAWSPDYRYLAYTRHQTPFSGCGFDISDINGVYFMDNDTGTLIEYNISTARYITPVGWVHVNNAD